MAYFSASSSYNWNLSLKLVLISTGVLTMALALKVSAPVVSDFVVSEIPSIWSFLLSWLRPPYLYILINCIIISIFASSKLQPRTDDSAPEMLAAPPTPTPTLVKDVREDYVVYGNDDILSRYGYDTAKASVPIPVERGVDSEGVEKTLSNEILMNAGHEAVLPRSAWNGGLLKQDSLELLFSNNEKENEKPPVSARFAHRKPVKASPEAGKALGVSKPKRQETLETTWKTITEGRSMPLTRHLKKSDTWEPHMRRNNQPTDENTPPPKMKKCETFPDRSANSSPGSARLKREPSLSQDDLNRRVEAFIKKFNDEMRLQRQESLNQYREMVHRGAQ